MSLHRGSILLLLRGLGGAVSEAAVGEASLTSLEAADSPRAAAAIADRSDALAPDGLPPGQERGGTAGTDMLLSPPAPPQEKKQKKVSGGSSEEEGEHGSHVVRGHLHVDLSLSTNVELLARLAPLMKRLMAQQEVLSTSTSAGSSDAVAPSSRSAGGVEEASSGGSAVNTKTTRGAPARAALPSIQMELSYHIFDMERGPTSAPHCVTGDLGRFCAFPPDDVPSGTEEQQRQVGGRAVAEEELLQLCLAEATRQNGFGEATAAAGAAAGRAGERREAAPTERAAAGNAGESKTAVTTTAASSPAQLNTSSMAGYSGSTGQPLKLLWDYLAGWCCNCSTRMHRCNPEDGAAATGGHRAPQIIREEPVPKQFSFPFQAACSRAQLERLSVPVPIFMERCEKAAADLLQNQVDSRLSVVPSLLLDGKPALGELTAESVLKTLCLVAEERAAAALPPGASVPQLPAVCRAPEIVNSPTLAVKSFGLGVNSDLIQDLDSGAPGELEVATHLLNTYARSPEGLATQPGAPTRPAVDTEGRYHFVNQKALRFLRKRLKARSSLRRSKVVPIVSAEEESKGSPNVSGSATPISAPAGTSWKPYVGSAATEDGVIAADRSGSTSVGESLAAIEKDKDNAVFQQHKTQAAVPLALDAPSLGLPAVVHPEVLSVEEGKRLQHGGPITLKQFTKNEAVAETSTPASEGLRDSTTTAQALPCEGGTEITACLHPDGAAETAVNQSHLFNADTTSWHLPLLLGFLVLVAAVVWLFKRRSGAALVSPPRPPRKPAGDQTALLDGKRLHAATSREL